MTNKKEDRLLVTEAYQDKIIAGLSMGLLRILRTTPYEPRDK